MCLDITGNPSHWILEKAHERIDAFKGTIRPDGSYKSRIFQSVCSASQQIANDYGDRFLLELIQNGYDAHSPDETAGGIRIYFDPGELDYGVLYVANRGHGFTKGNVEALTDLGLSDKKVGSGIGNKGLGFRSVLFITQDPQIYSRQNPGDGDDFDGFCFRFAHADDFKEFLDGILFERAKQDIPPFHVPLPLVEIPERLQPFAAAGFVTVIRLPVQSKYARDEVFRVMDELRKTSAPILLFLKRIRSLEVIVEGDPGKSFSLTREEIIQDFGSGSSRDAFSLVILNGNQRYFTAWHNISENNVKKAIQVSIDQKKINPVWSDWAGDGELSVAVDMTAEHANTRLYTYLPMGERAISPFRGHLQGCFYTEGNRTDFRPDIPVNTLFLEEAVELCARAIVAIRSVAEDRRYFSSKLEAGKLIIDLLVWKQSPGHKTDYQELLQQSFEMLGSPLVENDILLCLQRRSGKCWAAPGEVWNWDQPELDILGAQSMVSRADCKILPSAIGMERLNALSEFLTKIDENLRPDPRPEAVSLAVERIARELLNERASLGNWQKFYLELQKIYSKLRLGLHGKEIMLCGEDRNRELRHTLYSENNDDRKEMKEHLKPRKRRSRRQRAEPDVFTPPRLPSDSLKIPAELKRGFVFAAPDLDWHGKLDAARIMLEGQKLIRPYESEEIITQLSILVSVERSRKVRRKALAWTYKLYRNPPGSRPISLDTAALYVPNSEGEWIKAKDALFSSDWPNDTMGETLQEYLRLTAAINSPDLKELQQRLLAPPEIGPFDPGEKTQWAEFLARIGVNKGIQPIFKEDRSFSMAGFSLTAANMCTRFGIGSATAGYWEKEIAQTNVQPYYQSSLHKTSEPLWYFPGQEEFGSFSEQAKLKYAELILAWMENAKPENLSCSFYAPTAQWASRFRWPTPLAGFLKWASWLPVDAHQGIKPKIEFGVPSEIWLPKDERLPRYVPKLEKRIEKRAQSDAVSNFLQNLGANFFNQKENQRSMAKQIDFLGKLFAGVVIGDYEAEFLNDYRDAWNSLSKFETFEWDAETRPAYLVVRQLGKWVSVSLNSSQSPASAVLFVRDSEEPFKPRIMEARGFHVFDVGPTNSRKIADVLRKLLGPLFRPISSVSISLLLDGTDSDVNIQAADKLTNRYPWIPQVVCFAMESLSGTAAQSLPRDRSVILEKLDSIRVCQAKEISFRVDGQILAMPDDSYGVVDLVRPDFSAIVIETAKPALEWEDFFRAACSLARLLENSSLMHPIQLAIRTLERGVQQIDQPLSQQLSDMLCADLRVSQSNAAAALNALKANINRVFRFLLITAHYFGGESASASFSEAAGNAEKLEDLYEALRNATTTINIQAQKIIDVCRNATNLKEIRENLGLEFGRFNRSLCALEEDPETYPEDHKESVRSFIEDHRDEIMDCLRLPFIEDFEKRRPLDAYLKLRSELEVIHPPAEWLQNYALPPDHLISEFVSDWLRRNSAPSLESKSKRLHPYSETRRKNKVLAERFVREERKVVVAWCRKQGVPLAEFWSDMPSAQGGIFQLLDVSGVLDFEPIDKEQLIYWLAFAKLWPETMPRTLSVGELGLTSSDLDFEKIKEREEKEKRARAARSLDFNGRQIDPEELNYESLALDIESKIPQEIFRTELDDVVNLELVSDPKNDQIDRRVVDRKGSSRGGKPRIDPKKTYLIGFIGEYAVYSWLRQKYPRKNIDAAWVSEYREHVLPEKGHDNLGYDFEIREKGRKVYLEVKAHQNDPMDFELGETEILFARECAKGNKGVFRIVYLSNIQDTASMRIKLLPNPLGEEGRGFYRKLDEGLRYKFTKQQVS